MGINKDQLREYIVNPCLEELDPYIPYSKVAENLIMGTCAYESNIGTYVKQFNNGPALGIYQMEPNTHDDIYKNFLNQGLKNRPLRLKIEAMFKSQEANRMITDLLYSTVMCRVHYFRVPQPLPIDSHPQNLANYWKKYYNTIKGRGSELGFAAAYVSLIGVN